MKIFFLVGILLIGIESTFAQTYIDYYRQGVEAKKEGDIALFLNAIQKADSLRPNHPTILYNLAGAYSLNQDLEMAFLTLMKRISFNADSSFIADEDFEDLFQDNRMDELRGLIESSTSKKENSAKVFSITEKGFHPEGITYNKATKSFLISDVHEGRIVSYSRYGEKETTIINLSEQGYWGAFGLLVDPEDENILWVTTASIPEFKYFNEEDEGKSALLKVDIERGEILEIFFPKEEGNHMFGDLTISIDGTIYITDSIQPYICSLKLGEKELSLFLENNSWWNLQGITISEDNTTLFLSDYILGVLKVDIASKKVHPLLPLNKNAVTRGADGIYRVGKKLVLLQNGTYPIRTGFLELENKEGILSSELRVLDRAVKEIGEPTLGVVVGSQLYFIANSPWAFYTDERKPKLNEWPVVHIYSLTLY